jgi:hypothetical protein
MAEEGQKEESHDDTYNHEQQHFNLMEWRELEKLVEDSFSKNLFLFSGWRLLDCSFCGDEEFGAVGHI